MSVPRFDEPVERDRFFRRLNQIVSLLPWLAALGLLMSVGWVLVTQRQATDAAIREIVALRSRVMALETEVVAAQRVLLPAIKSPSVSFAQHAGLMPGPERAPEPEPGPEPEP